MDYQEERLFVVLNQEHETKLVEEVLAELKVLAHSRWFDLTQAVGELVTQRFFDGDIDAISRPGPKAMSLQRLAAHPDLPMSSRDLHLSVGLYILVQRYPELRDLRSNGDLTRTHFAVVLPAPSGEQPRLLQAASEQKWSVDELRKEVARINARTAHGRKSTPVAVLVVRHIAAEAAKLDGAIESLAELDSDRANALVETIEATMKRLQEYQERAREIGSRPKDATGDAGPPSAAGSPKSTNKKPNR